jgi:hypothetical protein
MSGSRILAVAAGFLVATALVTHARALSITTASITFPEVILDGTDQHVDGSAGVWQANAEGETGGWHISIASTDLDNGEGGLIPASNLEIRLLNESILWISGDPTTPVSTQTTYVSLGGTALMIVSADIGLSDGLYSLAPDVRLTVPAQTYIGTYTATVSVDINSGP